LITQPQKMQREETYQGQSFKNVGKNCRMHRSRETARMQQLQMQRQQRPMRDMITHNS